MTEMGMPVCKTVPDEADGLMADLARRQRPGASRGGAGLDAVAVVAVWLLWVKDARGPHAVASGGSGDPGPSSGERVPGPMRGQGAAPLPSCAERLVPAGRGAPRRTGARLVRGGGWGERCQAAACGRLVRHTVATAGEAF